MLPRSGDYYEVKQAFRDAIIGLVILAVWQIMTTQLDVGDSDLLAIVPSIIIIAIVIRVIMGAISAFGAGGKD